MIRIGSVKNTYPYFEKHIFQWQFRPLNIFPLTFEEITVTPYRKRHKNYTKAQIRKILSEDFQNYCKEMKKKGVEIIQNDVKIYRETNRYSAKGKLVLSGPFGIVQKGTVHELPKADAENIQQEGN